MQFLARAKRLVQTDELRTTLQTAAAVLIAYGIMEVTGTADPSWAVFSALFVVQANVGGTIGSALWRVAGALMGAAIAVLLIVLLYQRGWHGTGGWQTVAAMLIGVSLMSVISLRYPDLSYGLVTVTIITVSPDFYVVEGALSKVIAITIGSCSAILACILVLPVSAYRSADEKVAEAIRLCGHAIADCLHCATDGEARKKHEAEDEVSRRLRDAYLVWQQATMEKMPSRSPQRRNSRCTRNVLTHVQRLQENLALAERFSDHPLPPALCRRHKEGLDGLAQAIEAQLNDVSLLLTRKEGCLDATDVWERYRAFAEEADESARATEDPQEREHLMAIKWACNVILNNVDALVRELQPPKEA